jgi:glycosyltransferase involved in cell wall biosynthesis
MIRHKQQSGYLFVLPWSIAHPGGVNQVAANLYRQVDGYQVFRPFLLVADWRSRALTLKDEDGFDTAYYRLRAPASHDQLIKTLLLFVLTAPSRLLALRRFLLDKNIGILNPHYPTLDCLNFSLLKLLGLYRGKLVLSFHGADIANAGHSRGWERICWRLLLRSSDAIVTCSNSLAGAVSAFMPQIASKVHVVHNGVDISKIVAEVDRSVDVDAMVAGKPFILNIATFERKKGQDVLIRAFHRIHADFPEMRLVLIGRSGETEMSLRSLAEELGISGKVVMIKDLEHRKVTAILERAAIFALPSRVEPFGIVVLEAGIFNVPVVASAVGGVPEILQDGRNGYLVQPDDPDALAARITLLLRDRDEHERLSLSLQRHVRERFDWVHAYRRYLEIVTH